MKLIGVTMRADTHPDYEETRDALDQRWLTFLAQCGVTPILLPNNPTLVKDYLDQFQLDGVVLTGGNSPVDYGGDSPKRDAVDSILINWAIANNHPLIGVCRGMQSILLAFEHTLTPVSGHVAAEQSILINNKPETVNAYHNLASKECHLPLEAWASSDDGVIKAVKHQTYPVYGIMWHPERLTPFQPRDINFFQQTFK